MMHSDDEQYAHTPDMKQTDGMRAGSERHQISMFKAVITQHSACAVPHTVAMRHMTSSYQCMLYVSYIKTANILSILA